MKPRYALAAIAAASLLLPVAFTCCNSEARDEVLASRPADMSVVQSAGISSPTVSSLVESKAPDVIESVPEESAETLYYTEDEVIMLAKLLYRECRGIPSDTEKACVAWCVCNRVDSGEFGGNTVAAVITVPNQFAYRSNTPVVDELYEIAGDVLRRWNAERNGKPPDGRVLPKEFTYFSGDGRHNYFRNKYRGDYSVWDYSLPSPYES